ncbi:MAG TPA: hypothetical protein VKG22_04980 [Stellaceae bacterium]|nr:hypothetical protein [Stellaceae bacterium]HMD65986.1 hypothetical protein [Stellaceae bacterium]
MLAWNTGRIYGVNPAWSRAGLPSSMTIRYTEEAHGEIEHPVVRAALVRGALRRGSMRVNSRAASGGSAHP